MPSPDHTERLAEIGLAAIEVELCDAVNDDPMLRTAQTLADLIDARAALRALIDEHHKPTPRT